MRLSLFTHVKYRITVIHANRPVKLTQLCRHESNDHNYAMMTKTVIDQRGAVTTHTSDYVVAIEGFAMVPKYAAFSGPNQHISGSAIHKLVVFDTIVKDGGLGSLWNMTLNKFEPQYLNGVYTLRIDAVVPNSGSGDPTIHLDFDVSGGIAVGTADDHPHVSASFNRQSQDLVVRTQGNATPEHTHFHATFTVAADADLYVSGGHIYMASSDRNIAFLSASLFIKEG